MRQEQGVVGRAVGAMIRRSVKGRFHGLHWIPPSAPVLAPAILVANHHGWFDGYSMFLVAERLGLPFKMWAEEFEAFPAFASVGAMPFPVGDPNRRAATIRSTVRSMRRDKVSLILFPEGRLHPGPDLLPFGEALGLVSRRVPEAAVVPIGIRYEFSLHERPEAFFVVGDALTAGEDLERRAQEAVATLIEPRPREDFQPLFAGTLDVNERWDARRGRSR